MKSPLRLEGKTLTRPRDLIYLGKNLKEVPGESPQPRKPCAYAATNCYQGPRHPLRGHYLKKSLKGVVR